MIPIKDDMTEKIEIPAVPLESKHGKWVPWIMEETYYCSACGSVDHWVEGRIVGRYPYCPYCGAKMDVKNSRCRELKKKFEKIPKRSCKI